MPLSEQQKADLRQKAEAVLAPEVAPGAKGRFHYAADPATVLALLDECAAWRAEVARYKALYRDALAQTPDGPFRNKERYP